MSIFTLGETATLETITIRVKDRDKMIAFYQGIVGFSLIQEENALAMMGIKGSNKEHLWLEESPRAYPHFGEIKKLQHYTLKVASLAEIASIYSRALKRESPVIGLTLKEDSIQLIIEDPEENQLVIYFEPTNEAVATSEELLKQGDETTLLTAETEITGIHLNVPNQAKAQLFFNDILGVAATVPFLTLTDTAGKQFMTAEDEVLGLDFLKLTIEEADFLALEQHLIEKEQDFYIDKKKQILTIFDPMGIEWWFILKKNK